MIHDSCTYLKRTSLIVAMGVVLFGTSATDAAVAAGHIITGALNSYATRDNASSNEQRPRLATDGLGNWISMWNISGPGYESHAQSDLAFSNSTTSGTTWNLPVKPNLLRGSIIISADLAYAGNRKWVAIWISEVIGDNFNRQVWTATSDDLGQNWSTPQFITPPATLGTWPYDSVQLASDNNGKLMAVWLQGATGTANMKIITARSSDFGQSWSPSDAPSGIENDSYDKHAAIAYAGNGDWLMVYFNNKYFNGNNGVYYAAKSDDFGTSWIDIGPLYGVAENSQNELEFEIEARNGKVVIVANSPLYPRPQNTYFYDGVGIYVSNEDLTMFSTSLWLRTGELNPKVFATLAADDSGNWLLVTKPEKPASAALQVWQSNDPGSTWTLANTPAFPGVNSHMAAAGAGTGDFVVVTEHYGPPETLADADVDIQAIASGDRGDTWSAPAEVSTLDPSDLGVVQELRLDMEAGDDLIVACWPASVTYPPGEFNYPATTLAPIMISRSLDNGRTWSPAVELSGAFAESMAPCAMRFLDGGVWECFWEIWRYSNIFQRSQSVDGGLTWSAPVSIMSMPAPRRTTVAVSPPGYAVRVSSKTIESSPYTLETYVETSADGGATWQDPVLLYSESRPAMGYESNYTGEPAVVYAGSGRFAVLVKNIYKGRDMPYDFNYLKAVHLYLIESYDNGLSWSTPETVLQSARLLYGSYDTPMVASNGQIVVTWLEGDKTAVTGQDMDVFFYTKTFGAPSAATDWSLFE